MLQIDITLPKKEQRICFGLRSRLETTIDSNTSAKTEETRMARRIAAINQSKAKAAQDEWVAKCQALYEEYLKEKHAAKSANKWRRSPIATDQWVVESDLHDKIFADLISQYKAIFKKWAMVKALKVTKFGDSREFISSMVRESVSEVQKKFSEAIKIEENAECRAILSACRIKNYNKYCIDLAKEVRKYLYPEIIVK